MSAAVLYKTEGGGGCLDKYTSLITGNVPGYKPD